MFYRLVQLDDEVIVTLPEQVNGTDLAPCKDGIVAKVVGFGEKFWGRTPDCGIRPGVHNDRSRSVLELASGVLITISTDFISLTNSAEEMRRLDQFRAQGEHDESYHADDFAGDLPDTPFWELDEVAFVYPGGELRHRQGMVKNIAYDRLGAERSQGVLLPYDIQPGGNAEEAELRLVERGPVWHFYHGKAVAFDSLNDEAAFQRLLGLYSQVRHPESRSYAWPWNEIAPAIKSGIIDGINCPKFFLHPTSRSPIVYNNREIGRQVAEATLDLLRDQAA